MKQIISFEKEIAFKTMIGEVTSISLEHTLSFQGPSTISGDMIVSGTYKMTEASTLEEDFQYAIPVDIMLTKELEEDNRSITIHNFTYDIRNEDTLHLYIDVLVKGREVIELEEDEEEVIEPVREEQPKIDEEQVEDTTNDNKELLTDIEVEESQKVIDNIINTDKKEESVIKNDTQEEVKTTTDTKVMNSIFSAFANTEETYTTYSVYLLRENDSIENIIENYGVTREELSYYNDLDNLNVGSKIIIPTVKKDATAS